MEFFCNKDTRPRSETSFMHLSISSRLDYCNSLYSGLNHKATSCLQLNQNSIARLLTNSKKHDHISDSRFATPAASEVQD